MAAVVAGVTVAGAVDIDFVGIGGCWGERRGRSLSRFAGARSYCQARAPRPRVPGRSLTGRASRPTSSATRLGSPDPEGNTHGPQALSCPAPVNLDEAALPGLRRGRLFAGRHPPAMCHPAGRPAQAEGQAAEGCQPGRPAGGRRPTGPRRGHRGSLFHGELIRFRFGAGAICPRWAPMAITGRDRWRGEGAAGPSRRR